MSGFDSAVASRLGAWDALIGTLTPSLASLIMRIGLAIPYWKSGVLKWESFPFAVNDVAVLLFSDEFKLNIFGSQFPFPFPPVTAHIVALAEVILPVLLVLGLFTRFTALGLLIMAAVIQLTVPDGWVTHLAWAAMAFGIMAIGGGKLALDALVQPLLRR